MRPTIIAIGLLMLAMAPLTMAHLKRSATTGHLLKTSTGHLAKSCGGSGGPEDCDDDIACAACTAPSWVVNTPIGYECETEGGGPSSHTLAAGTYGTTHSGSCNWSGSPENCVGMAITCQTDELGVISYSWMLTSDYGLLASGTIDGPCPEATFNVN